MARQVQPMPSPRPAEASTAAPPRELALALYGFAFLSGAAALAYQVTWAKLLSLTFGGSTLATSAVVGGFLGGMGVGAWGYHLVQERVGAPLRIYALIEFGIAIAAAALTACFWVLPEVFARVASGIPAGLAADLFRVASVIVLLLVPSALMGATYPALCATIITTREGVDRHLGALYGINTLGAAAGALLAGLLLIPALGSVATVGTGVLFNLSVGGAALLLSRRLTTGPAAARPAAEDTAIPTQLSYRLTGTVILLSGFATLSYEILWFRALRYLVGNSTFALTIILVVFLLGLGFGALPLRRIVARGQSELDLARCQLAIAVLAALGIGLTSLLASSPGLSRSISVFSPAVQALPWWTRLAIHGGIALALMLPATLAMGLSFPLASRLFLGDARRVGSRVGTAYLLANVGSIVGAVSAAVLLLPTLGTVGGTRAIVSLNLLLGIFILAELPVPTPRQLRIVAIAAAAAFATALVFPDRIRFPVDVEIEFEEENDMGTVQVVHDRDEPRRKAMSIDGTIIGVSPGWHPTIHSKQILIAHLPLSIDRRLRSVVQIGLGSAGTIEALASYPTLERIEAVEINPAVVRGSQRFAESKAAADPRVRVVTEDAIHFLLRSRRTYDLVISDGKQNADFSGNAKLLSREFYALALARLSERGIFVQWLPVDTLHSDFRSILRTAAEVFPELELFVDPPGSVVLVGARQPLADRPRLPASAPEWTRAARDLAPFGMPSREQMWMRWMASRDAILEAVATAPLSTWNHSPVEFGAYRASAEELGRAAASNLALLMEIHQRSRAEGDTGFGAADPATRRAHDLVRRAYLRLFEGKPSEAGRLAREALAASPKDPMAKRALTVIGAEG